MCTSHSHDHDHDHEHSHETMENPGYFSKRDIPLSNRDYSKRAFTVGIGGPVGSGKTALLKVLCESLREKYKLGVVTNDIFTREDADFLNKHKALDSDRIIGVETGGCPHAAIREDISLNINALEELMDRFEGDIELLFVESGGDNLAADTVENLLIIPFM